MTIKDRIRKLRELHNIKTELDLLVMLLAELGHEDPEAQAKKEKYNFSKMLNGERKIKHEFVIPLQKIFNVSIDYIVNGVADDLKKSYVSRGLEHAVASNSINEYLKLGKLIDRNGNYVIYNRDEFQNTIFDYIVKYRSIEGIQYFVENKNLTYVFKDGVFELNGKVEYLKNMKSLPLDFASIIIQEDNLELFNKLFDKVSMIRYHDHPRVIYSKKEFIDGVLNSDNIFKNCIWIKKFPLYDINHKLNKEKMTTGIFVNPLINYLFERCLEKYRGNDEIIKDLLKFGYSSNCKVRDFILENIKTNVDLEITSKGIIKLENSIYGSVFYPSEKNIELLSAECHELINKIKEINEEIKSRPYANFDGIKKLDCKVENGFLYRKSVDNPIAYQFYEFANRHNITCVPHYYGTENGIDKFSIYDDYYISKESLGSEIVDMMRFLHALHDLSEKELGEGKVYVHNNLSLYNVFFREKDVIGVLNWDYCKIGDKFEDLLYMLCHWLKLEQEEDRDDWQIKRNIHTAVELFEVPKERYQNLSNQMIDRVKLDISRLDKRNENYEEMLKSLNRVLEFIEMYHDEIDNVELKNTSKRTGIKRLLLDKEIVAPKE